MNAHKEPFGQAPDAQDVFVYTLTNSKGLRARIMNFGATLVSMEIPDRDGNLADVTLGFDELGPYLEQTAYLGATIGRYGNRMGNAKFTLDGVEYKLSANLGVHQLHGGEKGFDKVVWNTQEMVAAEDEAWVKMTYLSKDGEEGYPGNLRCTVTYTLTNADELRINYEAETDKKTVINLTNHTYWNLAGQDSSDVFGHALMLNADKFTLIDTDLIPTGTIASIQDMPLDFTKPKAIGARMQQAGSGYDHNYVLNGEEGTMKPCARVREPNSGRVMEIFTTEPGVQLYTGNYLDGSLVGKKGTCYGKHAGFCLETQHFPDSPNKSDFPSTVLEPGAKYASVTVHKFSTE